MSNPMSISNNVPGTRPVVLVIGARGALGALVADAFRRIGALVANVLMPRLDRLRTAVLGAWRGFAVWCVRSAVSVAGLAGFEV
ncbi:MAG: hypothetical protein WAK44_10170, partial [Trebonia sp.]|uniref:hypothetical protein n=1 Tax=Trebonia sp. TaxID=2767075 RepID=UPI003BAF7099